MDTLANVPLALQRTQTTFGLQTLDPLKVARQRWCELDAELSVVDIVRTESVLADLQSAEDQSAFARLLPNAFWQTNQRAMGVLQGMLQMAISNQPRFVADYQRVVLE